MSYLRRQGKAGQTVGRKLPVLTISSQLTRQTIQLLHRKRYNCVAPIMTTLDSERSLFSAESYFGTQPPPSTLDHDIADVRSFVHQQRDLGRKVVLVTVSVARRRPLLLSAQARYASLSLSRAAEQPSHWSSTCEQCFARYHLCLELTSPCDVMQGALPG